MTLENTQEIINGAEVIAAGRTLGLTDDEAIETKRQTLRRNIEQRRADRVKREGNRAAAEQFLLLMKQSSLLKVVIVSHRSSN